MSEYRKKLIEVALPLEEINAASVAYKAARVGTIRNIHKWFAAMPLPAWRALLYASLIDDPEDDEKRAYHLDLIKRLVSSGVDLPDEQTLAEARRQIRKQFPDSLPAVLDPFCGGGSTLVEAQRLGLPTMGSDLNPVPVLITRVLTEVLPSVFGGQPLHPVAGRASKNPDSGQQSLVGQVSSIRYSGLDGLAADVYHYAAVVRDAVSEKASRYYPVERGVNPVAWVWMRTAMCPNPTCAAESVLTTSWWLSKKKGQMCWIEPRVQGDAIVLEVVAGQATGEAPEAPKQGRGANFACIACGGLITEDELIRQGRDGQIGLRLAAVVEEREGQRTFRQPTEADTAAAMSVPAVADFPEIAQPDIPRWFSSPRFGFTELSDLYTARQMFILRAFAEEIAGLAPKIEAEGASAEWALAITSVLALTLGKVAQSNSTQTRWKTSNQSGGATAQSAFGRNDMPMAWDFAETYPLGVAVGSFVETTVDQVRAFKYIADPATVGANLGSTQRGDARQARLASPGLVATDPPYFDAIGYADLSDYFYVWHRLALRNVHPDLYTTMAAPKSGELTAVPAHHEGSAEKARQYFIHGFTETFGNLQESLSGELPMIIVYASKEQKGGAEEETRWSSILTAMVAADLEITGTWPIHGTSTARMIGQGTNSVAAYVVMACRPRAESASSCSLADFNRTLRRELKSAVRDLQAAGVLPVDLAQAALGPGMQVYSRYKAVLDQAGGRVPVDQALRLINQALGEILDEQEGDLDPDSRFAVTWWSKHHWAEASFGEADQLARPQGISVDDVVRAGVAVYPRPGFVRVVGEGDVDREWKPARDKHPTAWEAVHHLADRLIDGGGIAEAGALMGQLGVLRDQAQGLVYRLHAIAARKGWTKDQERYNSLIGSWSDLLAESGRSHGEMDGLF